MQKMEEEEEETSFFLLGASHITTHVETAVSLPARLDRQPCQFSPNLEKLPDSRDTGNGYSCRLDWQVCYRSNPRSKKKNTAEVLVFWMHFDSESANV